MDISEKVAMAIERIKNFEPPEGYYLAFSGGKDSMCVYHLVKMAGVKYDAHYQVSTIDAPETVYFIRDNYPDVKFENPEKPFLQMLLPNGYPSRVSRWCCRLYKEVGGENRVVLTGVRWAESVKRKGRKMVESCFRTHKRYVRPIIDWSDDEVWAFIKQNKLKYNVMYDEGFKRVGCLFCPLASPKFRALQARRYPKFVEAFKRSFIRLYEDRVKKGKPAYLKHKNGEEFFYWWLYGDGWRKYIYQTDIFDLIPDAEEDLEDDPQDMPEPESEGVEGEMPEDL